MVDVTSCRSKMNHYKTLDVPIDASADELKKAYRRKARQAHPDLNKGSHQQMVAVNRAYDTLSDAQKRAHYDRFGEEGPRVQSLDEMATAQLCNLLFQFTEQAPEQLDHVAEMLTVLAKSIDTTRLKIEKLRDQKTSLERRRKRFKYKGKMRNFLIDAIDQRIGQIPESIERGLSQIKTLERSIELLRDYEWTGAEGWHSWNVGS
jgi:DnaJ-class molecular chaperone